MLYRIVIWLARIFCAILFRLESKGRENIPKKGAFILVSNHVSYLDPVVLAVVCPRQLNFMARHDLFTIPIFGSFIFALKAFPVRRNYADITGIKETLRRLGQAEGVLLFPEGGRPVILGGQKIESGIGFVAAKSQVPVVPAFVDGTRRAFGRYSRFIRPVKVRVYFGRPIHFKNRKAEDTYKDFAQRVIQEIYELGQEARKGSV